MLDQKFAKGFSLYGDDFNSDEIEKWFKCEAEAYANLGSKRIEDYNYSYHQLNYLHGFKHLKDQKFEKTLGFGSAWGHEFFPIINQIDELYILEPSENLRSKEIKGKVPQYSSPSITGEINFEDNTFDLITCFGVLHHIPNVGFVIDELLRVLKPNGYLLIREPIISMGDWNMSRKGLTKNERGIPLNYFEQKWQNKKVYVLEQSFCFCMTALFQRAWEKMFMKPIYSYSVYVLFDKFLSRIFKFNLHYHAQNKFERIAPQSVFYVLRKN